MGTVGCDDDDGETNVDAAPKPADAAGGSTDAASASEAGATADGRTTTDGGATPDGVSAACPSLGPLQPPTVPAALQPPAGATLVTRTRATGTQIYTCQAMGAAFAWTLKAPEAVLSDEACAPVGTHGAGPHWKWTADGSTVNGAAVATSPAPATGSIAWVVLRAVSTSGSGKFGEVTAVQRVDTAGGVAPATGCDASTVGKETAVPYTATYYFYKGASFPAPDAGASDAGSDAGASADH
jgi:hypothetical protein